MDAPNFALIAPGDAAPRCIAFKSDGKLFASEEQAGRPIVVLAAAKIEDPRILNLIAALEASLPILETAGCDAIALTREDVFAAFQFQQAHQPRLPIAGQADAFIAGCGLASSLPCLLLLDRNWRTVFVRSCGEEAADDLVRGVCADLACLPQEEMRRLNMPAPVLILPNLIDRSLCAELIKVHETGGNFDSGVTSVDRDGNSYLKLDHSRKARRDHWVADGTAIHAQMLNVFATRLFPEIKKVFQVEIAHTDRLLIACYPEHEGIFKRHRDNSSPTVRFRQFAVSLNLNAGAYEGGDLIFPEYSPHLYSPPAGGAAVFSASLLHEVTRITRGQRYVLLSFLHDAASEELRAA